MVFFASKLVQDKTIFEVTCVIHYRNTVLDMPKYFPWIFIKKSETRVSRTTIRIFSTLDGTVKYADKIPDGIFLTNLIYIFTTQFPGTVCLL